MAEVRFTRMHCGRKSFAKADWRLLNDRQKRGGYFLCLLAFLVVFACILVKCSCCHLFRYGQLWNVGWKTKRAGKGPQRAKRHMLERRNLVENRLIRPQNDFNVIIWLYFTNVSSTGELDWVVGHSGADRGPENFRGWNSPDSEKRQTIYLKFFYITGLSHKTFSLMWFTLLEFW